MSINQECPCCLEPITGTTIPHLTNDDLAEMHINGLFISQWKLVSFNNITIYLLKINDNIYLPFKSINDIVRQFRKPYGFYQEYFETLTPTPINHTYNFIGKCNHSLCFDCYNRITENKCPICRQDDFLSPKPLKTIMVGRILWEENYDDFPYIDENSETLESNESQNDENELEIDDNSESNESRNDENMNYDLSGNRVYYQNQINEPVYAIPYNSTIRNNLMICRNLIDTILNDRNHRFNQEYLDNVINLIHDSAHLIESRNRDSRT